MKIILKRRSLYFGYLLILALFFLPPLFMAAGLVTRVGGLHIEDIIGLTAVFALFYSGGFYLLWESIKLCFFTEFQ